MRRSSDLAVCCDSQTRRTLLANGLADRVYIREVHNNAMKIQHYVLCIISIYI